MIKQGLKNYFKSFKYYIPSLGLFMLFFLIGVSILIKFVGNNLNILSDSISKVAENGTKTDISLFFKSISDSFNQTNNFFENLIKFFAPSNLYNVISKALVASLGISDVSSIEGELSKASNDVTNGIYGLLIFSALGFLACYLYIKINISKDMKMKQGLSKIILVVILGYILNITVISLAFRFVNRIFESSLIIMVVTIFINEALALFKAYLLRTQKSIKFKKIFTFKNILLLSITTIITLLITILLLVVLSKNLNESIAYLLVTPAFFIALTVVNLNAYEYIKDYFRVYNN